MLDTCTRLLIFEFEEKVEVQRREVSLDIYSQSERFEILRKLDPDAVICCGISDVLFNMLQAIDIQLICGIIGDVDEVLDAYFCSQLDAPCFRMPGYKENS